MKKIILSVVVGCISCSAVFASEPRTIYGLQHAATLPLDQQGNNLFIQANGFSEHKNAYHYQQELQIKTKYPVRVVTTTLAGGKFYQVIIGPMPSTYELRKTAAACLSSSAMVDAATRFDEQVDNEQSPVTRSFAHEKVYPIPNMQKTDPLTWLSRGQWFVAAGVGGLYPQWPSQMTVNNGSGFPAPYSLDVYDTQQNGAVVIDLTGGYRWQIDRPFFPAASIGLMWQYGFNNDLGHNITEYSDPTFLDYTYSLKANTNVLLALAKLNVYQYEKLSPYVNVGLGGAFNQTSHYSETALADVTPRVSPGFQDGHANAFAYIAGVGLDYALTPNIMISAGYNYLNVGQVSTGQGVGTWATQALNLGSSGANEFLIQINYLFDNNNATY